ncbi:hypothetical protein ACFQMG_29530, partial [Kitasatospora paranensis]
MAVVPVAGRFTPQAVECRPSTAQPHSIVTDMVEVGARENAKLRGPGHAAAAPGPVAVLRATLRCALGRVCGG